MIEIYKCRNRSKLENTLDYTVYHRDAGLSFSSIEDAVEHVRDLLLESIDKKANNMLPIKLIDLGGLNYDAPRQSFYTYEATGGSPHQVQQQQLGRLSQEERLVFDEQLYQALIQAVPDKRRSFLRLIKD